VTPPRLSVCIPTYNFGPFIGETLAALADQARAEAGVEVVVLDSGSTDDTRAVVEGFAGRLPGLRYHRTERPQGIDRDLAATVALARGEHCWLLSSDDVPAPGALQALLGALASDRAAGAGAGAGAGPDVLLCSRTECDRALQPIRTSPWLAPGIVDGDFRLSDPAELGAYLAAARSIGALFSYISSIVVRRAAWEAAPPHDELVGTHYAHVARLFASLRRGGALRYVRAPLVLCRGENDSFATRGVVRRFQIDVEGYLRLADALFPEPALRAAFLAVMRLEHPWWVYAEVRSRVAAPAEWRQLRADLRRLGHARWQLAVVGALGATPPLMALARWAWFGLRRLRRP
jgi:abequosyltransferase